MNRILVIEDEAALGDNITSVLEMNKYEVHYAKEGRSGYELAVKFLPDIILCDIMMPEFDGYWVLEQVRSNHELKDTPFIFLTAKVDRDDLRKGMELGADDYITKPFKISELIGAIEARLKRNKEIKRIVEKHHYEEVKLDLENFILLDTGKEIERIKLSTIECIFAENVLTKIFLTDNKIISVRKSLTKWENLLPENTFIRIHRAAIINLLQIKKIEKWFNQTMLVHMQNYDKPITISRGFTSKLKGKVII